MVRAFIFVNGCYIACNYSWLRLLDNDLRIKSPEGIFGSVYTGGFGCVYICCGIGWYSYLYCCCIVDILNQIYKKEVVIKNIYGFSRV